MSGAVWADPDHIRGVAPRIDDAAARTRDALATLRATLDAEGACWGADETGATFSSGYLPAADSAEGAIATVAESLTNIATGLRNTAKAFESTDESNANRLGGWR